MIITIGRDVEIGKSRKPKLSGASPLLLLCLPLHLSPLY